MANIQTRREDVQTQPTQQSQSQSQAQTQPQAQQQAMQPANQPAMQTWDPFRMIRDPFRMMRDFMRWDPFQEMRAMPGFAETSYAPAFEVKETNESFIFKADVPGLKENDLDIAISGDRLTISGKRETEKSDKDDTWYTYERTYGSFSRAFTLPRGIDPDHAQADLKEGVLTLIVPKRPELQGRKISIKAGDKAKA